MHRQSYRWIKTEVIKTGLPMGATPYVYGFVDNDTVHLLALGSYWDYYSPALYTYSSFRIKEEEVLLRLSDIALLHQDTF